MIISRTKKSIQAGSIFTSSGTMLSKAYLLSGILGHPKKVAFFVNPGECLSVLFPGFFTASVFFGIRA
ncbi:MAG: hypothetical protein CVU89_01525 [Firmicutes bacterium HGW-Firmicutes-14]|nr:MAG: hypothetical protein CVU89_01525 [Firmicutes bacterium HGW-Firmicutes-14]